MDDSVVGKGGLNRRKERDQIGIRIGNTQFLAQPVACGFQRADPLAGQLGNVFRRHIQAEKGTEF